LTNRTEILRRKLVRLVDEINANLRLDTPIKFHRQNKVPEHMSLYFVEKSPTGRLYIQPLKSVCYIDVAPYGLELEKDMQQSLNELFDTEKCDGFKHSGERQPYWRIPDDNFGFSMVKKAAYLYAEYAKVNL